MYREDGEVIEVPENELPLKLPDDIDLSIPGNPLDNHPTWKYTKCPETGMKAIRETDTLDTFVDSAWYFLRFCSPLETNEPFNKMKLIIGCQLINMLEESNMLFYIYYIQGSLLKL